MNLNRVIQLLDLVPLPGEGGLFRQTFRSAQDVSVAGERRRASTAIYYLLQSDDFSAIHRVPYDEVFHHYAGDAVELFQWGNFEGGVQRSLLGKDLDAGERPQIPVRSQVWQGSRLVSGGKWALLGCTVSPGFEDGDLELISAAQMCVEYPGSAALIKSLTRS